jgi:hypothetical protein
VRYNNAVVDPFVGLSPHANCGATVKPIWQDNVRNVLTYSRGIPYVAGITVVNPTAAAARAGTLAEMAEIPSAAEKIFVWADLIGTEAGDRIEVRMTPPGGKTVGFGRILPSQNSRYFFEAGLSRPGAGWAPGTYRFDVLLIPRGGEAGFHNQTSRTVTVK